MSKPPNRTPPRARDGRATRSFPVARPAEAAARSATVRRSFRKLLASDRPIYSISIYYRKKIINDFLNVNRLACECRRDRHQTVEGQGTKPPRDRTPASGQASALPTAFAGSTPGRAASLFQLFRSAECPVAAGAIALLHAVGGAPMFFAVQGHEACTFP